jgi:hypothetical protein
VLLLLVLLLLLLVLPLLVLVLLVLLLVLVLVLLVLVLVLLAAICSDAMACLDHYFLSTSCSTNPLARSFYEASEAPVPQWWRHSTAGTAAEFLGIF